MFTASPPAKSSSIAAGTTVVDLPALTFSSGYFGWGVRLTQLPGWMWAGISGLVPGSTSMSTRVRPPRSVNETDPVTPDALSVWSWMTRLGAGPAGRRAITIAAPAMTTATARTRTSSRLDGALRAGVSVVDVMSGPRDADRAERQRRHHGCGGAREAGWTCGKAHVGVRRCLRVHRRGAALPYRWAPSAVRTDSPVRGSRRVTRGLGAARVSRSPRPRCRAGASR